MLCSWLCGNVIRSFRVISDELTYDKFSVFVFLKTVIENLKAEFPALKTAFIFF